MVGKAEGTRPQLKLVLFVCGMSIQTYVIYIYVYIYIHTMLPSCPLADLWSNWGYAPPE